MEIIQAKDSDFIEILYLLRVCILDMNQNGLKHWNSVYPGPEIIQEDLAKSSIYLVKDKGVCKGMVTLDTEEPEEYKGIQWTSTAQKAVVPAPAGCASQLAGAGYCKKTDGLLPKNSPGRTDSMHSGLMFSVTACMRGIYAGKTVLMKPGISSVFFSSSLLSATIKKSVKIFQQAVRK